MWREQPCTEETGRLVLGFEAVPGFCFVFENPVTKA